MMGLAAVKPSCKLKVSTMSFTAELSCNCHSMSEYSTYSFWRMSVMDTRLAFPSILAPCKAYLDVERKRIVVLFQQRIRFKVNVKCLHLVSDKLLQRVLEGSSETNVLLSLCGGRQAASTYILYGLTAIEDVAQAGTNDLVYQFAVLLLYFVFQILRSHSE